MTSDLGLSDTAYGLGAGIFFIGYFLFEVPSNLILHRVGARIWIARIMITWGMVSSAMMFVPASVSFYILRFLLGIAEAGFFPGIILYLTYWFPRRRPGAVVALFFLAVPLSSVIGAPISTLLIQNGNGVLGFDARLAVHVLRRGHPGGAARASWCCSCCRTARRRPAGSPRRQAPRSRRSSPPRTSGTVPHSTGCGPRWPTGRRRGAVGRLLRHRLRAVRAGVLPAQVISGFSGSSARSSRSCRRARSPPIPYAIASVVMVLVARHSDRTGERRGTSRSRRSSVPPRSRSRSPGLAYLVMAAITVTACGVFAAIPVIWQIPPTFLTGVGAAAGIALINSFGNLSGFAGPYLTGWLKT